MTPQEKEHIENAIRHVQTATDIDPWAAEIAVESMRKRITPTSVIVGNGWMTKNDIAIHIINEMRNIIIKNDSWTEDATTAVNEAADMAIKALEAQEWVPCKERLPEEDHWLGGSGKQFSDNVLISITNREDEDAWSDISQTIDGKLALELPRHCKITAWRSLPEPYREDGD